MIDLIAEGMMVRNQLTSSAGAAVSAKIRSHPQVFKKPVSPTTIALSESSEAIIRKSAVSATPTLFELSIEAFRKDGLELIPDDLAFLRQRLPFDPGKRDAILAQYREVWHEAIAAEPASHRTQNRGRFAANTWLRSSNHPVHLALTTR
jgi:hypothetical protein